MIRRAIKADADKVQSLLHKAYGARALAEFPASAATVALDTVIEWIAREEIFVHARDEKIVGTFRLNRYDEFGLMLGRLAVDPDYSGQKIGPLLIAAAEKQAMIMGENELSLKTAEQHPFLVGYYQALGYEYYAKSYQPGDDYPEVVLRKSL